MLKQESFHPLLTPLFTFLLSFLLFFHSHFAPVLFFLLDAGVKVNAILIAKALSYSVN